MHLQKLKGCKVLTRYVKGVPFFNRRYMKGIPFPYKMVKKRGPFKFVLSFIRSKFVFWPRHHRLVRVCMPSGTMLCCGENVRLPLSSSDSPRCFFWPFSPTTEHGHRVFVPNLHKLLGSNREYCIFPSAFENSN